MNIARARGQQQRAVQGEIVEVIAAGVVVGQEHGFQPVHAGGGQLALADGVDQIAQFGLFDGSEGHFRSSRRSDRWMHSNSARRIRTTAL